FAHQIHDSVHAGRYLSTLNYIDSGNAVVRAFSRVVALDESLKHASAQHERSDLHLSLARLNKQIELNEEATDEAERALSEEPVNLKALLLLASVFERKGKPFRSLSVYQEIIRLDPHVQFAAARA